jgi:hypothetical protein
MQACILRLICEGKNDDGLELRKTGTAAQEAKQRTEERPKDSRRQRKSHQDHEAVKGRIGELKVM